MGAGIGGSALRVYLLVDGAEWAPRELPGGTLEWIVPVRAGARIEARRTGLNIYKQFCSYDPTTPCQPPHYAYELEPVGLAGVYVEGVVPLRVVGPGGAAGDTARVTPGQEATFTVEAIDGISPTQWYFLAWEGSVRMLGSCYGRVQCTVVPPTRGAVIVYGLWNGYTFGSEYLHIKATALQVTLTCTPSATRGADVTCEATWVPSTIAATDINFEWRFDPDSVRVFPDPAAQAFAPPPPTGSTGTGLREWSGPAVIGGRVSLRASYGGTVSTDSARISISARTGAEFGDLPVTFAAGFVDIRTDSTVTLAAQPPVDPGGQVGMVGQNYDPITGRGGIEHAIRGTPVLAMVATGPNAGYWYVTNPNVQSTRGVRMRTWISGGEKPKFRYPTHPGLLTNRALLQARRTQPYPGAPRMHNDSTELFLGVLAHESYGRNGKKGHQGQIERAAKLPASCGRVPNLLEQVVAGDLSQAEFATVIVLEEGRKSLYAAAGHNHVHGNYSNAPFYEVVATATQAVNLPWMVAVGDRSQPADSDVAPEPAYHCSRAY
jgi:hypothetical protein